MSDDYYDRTVGGIRQPDPTLGVPTEPPQWPQWAHQPHQPHQPQPHQPQQPRPEQPERSYLDPPTKPRRQRVVLAEPSRSPGSLRARVELEEQTSWGELLIRDLIKVQLRSGIAMAALVLLVLGALPLAFFLSPEFTQLRLVGIPVAWLLLGVAPFPLLFGVGLWYNRVAERHERDFVNMIEK